MQLPMPDSSWLRDPLALFDFDDLDRVVTSESARPVGIHVNGLAQREYSYLAPGMDRPVRITTDAEFYQEHTESVELWSPGNPVFPTPEFVIGIEHLPRYCSVTKILDSTGVLVIESEPYPCSLPSDLCPRAHFGRDLRSKKPQNPGCGSLS